MCESNTITDESISGILELIRVCSILLLGYSEDNLNDVKNQLRYVLSTFEDDDENDDS